MLRQLVFLRQFTRDLSKNWERLVHKPNLEHCYLYKFIMVKVLISVVVRSLHIINRDHPAGGTFLKLHEIHFVKNFLLKTCQLVTSNFFPSKILMNSIWSDFIWGCINENLYLAKCTQKRKIDRKFPRDHVQDDVKFK